MKFSMLGVSGSAPGGQVQGVDSFGSERTFNVSDYRGRFLVLVFYHADWDCVEYLEAFAELSDKFKSTRAEVVFCSTDSPKAHACWLKTERSDGGFGGHLGGKVSGLWSDPAGTLAVLYDLYNEEDNECLDGVVIVDEDSVVRHAMTTSMEYHDAAANTLDLVKMMKTYSVSEQDTKTTPLKDTSVPAGEKKKEAPKTETIKTNLNRDWDVSEDPKLIKAKKIAEKLGLPSPPQLIYCQRKPVFDLVPARIRRMINPKAALFSCSASLHRNFIGFEDDQAIQLENTVKRVLGKEYMADDLAGSFTSLTSLSPRDRQSFLDNQVFQLSGNTHLVEAAHTSDGQGVFVSNYKNLVAWVNMESHLSLVSFAQGQDLKYVLLRLQKAITKIEEAMKACGLCGFLTSNGGFQHSRPGVFGTGLQVSLGMQLPGLERAGTAEVEKVQTELGLTVKKSNRNTNIFNVEVEQNREDRELDIITRSVEKVDSLWKKDMELQSQYGV